MSQGCDARSHRRFFELLYLFAHGLPEYVFDVGVETARLNCATVRSSRREGLKVSW